MTKRLRRDRDADEEANAYAGMQCTELTSLHNASKMLVDGCVYRLDVRNGRKFYWICDNSRIACPVRLTTAMAPDTRQHAVIDVGRNTEHTHSMTVDPMDGVVHAESVYIKVEDADTGGHPPTAQLQHDFTLECSIVLQSSSSSAGPNVPANTPQLCVSNRQLYNLRANGPADQLYRWECSNRAQLLCGSRIQTSRAGGRHVAVHGSFLEHSAKCERLHDTHADVSNVEAAKVEPAECDFAQPCAWAVSLDGGREQLTAAGFRYHLQSMRNLRYYWTCTHDKKADADDAARCPGGIVTTLFGGRHVILLNSFRKHIEHGRIVVPEAERAQNGRTSNAKIEQSKDGVDNECSESDESSADDNNYCVNVKIEHQAPDSPPTDDENAYNDDAPHSDGGTGDEDAFGRDAAVHDTDDDDDDDDDDDFKKPIAQLIDQERQRRQHFAIRPLLRGPNEPVPCFTIPTTRGNDKLCVDGYVYYQERKPLGDRAYWACAKRKYTQCCGRLVTVTEADCYVVQSITMRPHNHDPCVTNLDKVGALAQLRKMAVESRCNAAGIAAAVLANCTAEAKREMPGVKRLVRRVHRVRASEGISLPTDAAKSTDGAVDDDDDDDGDVADDDCEDIRDDVQIKAERAGDDDAAKAALAAKPSGVRRASNHNRYMDLDPNVPIVCSTVPSRRGNEKLCVLGYVYHLERKATSKSYHWACERRKRYDPPCLARVVTQLDDKQMHVIDPRRGVRAHNHTSPPDDGAATRRPSRRPYNTDELREAEARRLARQLETNSVIPCTTIPTARGNETLFVQGYTYHCDRRSELFVYWKCVLSKLPHNKCPGRVTTTLQGEQHVVLSATLREHTHAATDSDEERYRACAQLRQLAQETQLDADSIIAMVLADCSEECREKLGSISVLKKKVVRARNGEDTVSKVWREQMLTPLERERWTAIGRLKEMARQTTQDARAIVAAVLADCTPECRAKLGNVVELRKKVGRVRLAKDKREAKQRAKAAKAAAAAQKPNGDIQTMMEEVVAIETRAEIKHEDAESRVSEGSSAKLIIDMDICPFVTANEQSIGMMEQIP